ncbi:MAG: family 16 glycosylhydrolase [Luteitalea sp.]|nr:family 16 glycosylhydrolase [Luteitalea sp.]
MAALRPWPRRATGSRHGAPPRVAHTKPAPDSEALMKRLIPTVIVLLSVASSAPAESGETPLAGYVLVWSDEFEGASLDTAHWNYRTDSKHWSAQAPQNVSVENGDLLLTLRKQKREAKKYTGAGVISKRLFGYGYYEARFRIAAGKGWHSSFWMMKHDGSGGTGTNAADLELDVIENDSINLNRYGVNTHRWKGEHASFGHKNVQTPPLSDFHVYGCEYTPSEVRYFFDGKLVQSLDISGQPQGDLHIWLTSIASHLGNTDRVDDSRLPGHVYFDYVRFYEKKPQ